MDQYKDGTLWRFHYYLTPQSYDIVYFKYILGRFYVKSLETAFPKRPRWALTTEWWLMDDIAKAVLVRVANRLESIKYYD